MIGKSLACPVCGGSIAPGVRFLPDDVVELTLAERRHRFLHFVCDQIMLALALLLLIPLCAAAGALVLSCVWLLWLLLWVGYYVGFEYLQGRTPSQRLTRSWVVSEEGTRPRLRAIVGRTFARLLPWEPISVLADPLGIGLHDRFSGTRVVRAPGGPRPATAGPG